MKLIKLLLPVVTAVLLFTACCGGKMCPDNTLVLRSGLTFQNFTAAEMDSVKILEYWASSNFTTVMDSIGFRVSTYDSLRYSVSFDSAQTVAPDSAMSILVSFHHDSLVYKITNITYQAELCSKCYGHKTYGSVLSGYKINGVATSLTYNPWGITITK